MRFQEIQYLFYLSFNLVYSVQKKKSNLNIFVLLFISIVNSVNLIFKYIKFKNVEKVYSNKVFKK